jgi:hypothetical protein
MEKNTLKEDVKVLCRRVTTFRLGIKEAFNSMIDLLPGGRERAFYGISYLNESGEIVYKVALSQSAEGEAEKYAREPFTITKGDYLSEKMLGWMEKTDKIKDVLMGLMEDPCFDNGYPCIEWYKSEEELICMVRIISSKNKE